MPANLSPTAQAILQALTEGPATATRLRKTIGRNQATIDKALKDLVTQDLVIPILDGETDGQPQYSLPPNTATSPDANPDPAADTDSDSDSDSDQTPDAATDVDQQNPDDGAETVDTGDRVEADTTETQQPEPDPATPHPQVDDDPQDADAIDPAEAPAGEPGSDTGSTPADHPDANPEETATGAEGDTQDVKICKGCQTRMPLICPCCGRKTPAYCSACQTKRPAARRSAPGEREILTNGLPKLRTGELAQMVHKVMTEHPVPEYKGVRGWTSSRIAVFLPGRSTGAIGESLEKLANTGQAEFLGENPRRYVLIQPDTNTDNPDTDSGRDSGPDMASGPDGASPDAPDTPIAQP
jgi:hypothetical protein